MAHFIANWAQIYAERERINNIAGIKDPDYSDLDIAIIDNDFFRIREYSDEILIEQYHEIKGEQTDLTADQWAEINDKWLFPSLKHNIQIQESRILQHSLGDPDMSPKYLRAYHTMLFQVDSGRDETNWGATYQQRINALLKIRKNIVEEKEDIINKINSAFSINTWLIDSWGKNQDKDERHDN